ncbi:hypothetical protein [Flavobacterium psychrophilum]|uniref:hypothetical protein n=1 Tax=Flavobacterium psychrophilum TaxID=96345 RepID=UPI000B7C2F11|nr:hypothetical protein [Flavobacterium psychrophilum]EKT3956281.1 hypothetical protein [Flavobacterium psychrophilum]EKT4509679.1 hypothetical protein [Flavobacterium psychrophilum]SNB36323.1 hypothetical protein NO098_280114 [Flavobacterium psychrophilum]
MGQNIKDLFIEFLKVNKSYPEDSFLSDHHIIDLVSENNKRPIDADLAILDTVSNNYLAFVEFKQKISLELNQYELYLGVLNNPDLRFYFVEPFEENDFKIYILFENKLQQISKEDFPNYKTLKAKSLADKKAEIEKQLFERKKEYEKKKSTITSTLIATILSLVTALTLTQSLDIFNFKSVKNNKEIENVSKQIEKKINELKNKIIILETKKDTITKTDVEIQSLKNRIKTIENLISQDPRSLLEIQKTDNQFDRINLIIDKEKEINNQKIEKLEDKLNTYSNIIFSLLVTFIGAILGYLFSNFRDNKNVT